MNTNTDNITSVISSLSKVFLKLYDGKLVLAQNSSRFKAQHSIRRGSEVLRTPTSFVQPNFITATATAGNIDSDVINNTIYIRSGKRYTALFTFCY